MYLFIATKYFISWIILVYSEVSICFFRLNFLHTAGISLQYTSKYLSNTQTHISQCFKSYSFTLSPYFYSSLSSSSKSGKIAVNMQSTVTITFILLCSFPYHDSRSFSFVLSSSSYSLCLSKLTISLFFSCNFSWILERVKI